MSLLPFEKADVFFRLVRKSKAAVPFAINGTAAF